MPIAGTNEKGSRKLEVHFILRLPFFCLTRLFWLTGLAFI